VDLVEGVRRIDRLRAAAGKKILTLKHAAFDTLTGKPMQILTRSAGLPSINFRACEAQNNEKQECRTSVVSSDE
jgi:hypothetical protein